MDNDLRDLLTEQVISATAKGFEIRESEHGKIAVFDDDTKGLGLSLNIDISTLSSAVDSADSGSQPGHEKNPVSRRLRPDRRI